MFLKRILTFVGFMLFLGAAGAGLSRILPAEYIFADAVVELPDENLPPDDSTEPPASACPHSWSTWYHISGTTCLSDLNAIRFCSICGTTEQSHQDGLGHTFETITEQATCQAEGTVYEICTTCWNSETYRWISSIPKLEHKLARHTVKPTCTTEGYTEEYCEYGCGYTNITDRTDALGHKFPSFNQKTTEWLIDWETSTGLFYRLCTREDCTEHYNEWETVYTMLQNWKNGVSNNTPDFVSPVDNIFFVAHSHKLETDVIVSPTCVSDGYLQQHCSLPYCADAFDADGNYVEGQEYKIAQLLNRDSDNHSWVFGAEIPTCEHGGYNFLECQNCHRRTIITNENQGSVIFVGNGSTTGTTGSSFDQQVISPGGTNGCDAPESLSYIAYQIAKIIRIDNNGNIVFDEETNAPVIDEQVTTVAYVQILTQNFGTDIITSLVIGSYSADTGHYSGIEGAVLPGLLSELAEKFDESMREQEESGEVIPVTLTQEQFFALKSVAKNYLSTLPALTEDVGGFGDKDDHTYSGLTVATFKNLNADYAFLAGITLSSDEPQEITLSNGQTAEVSVYNNDVNLLYFDNEGNLLYREVLPPCMRDFKIDYVCEVCGDEIHTTEIGEHEPLILNSSLEYNEQEGRRMLHQIRYCSCGEIVSDEWVNSQAADICLFLQDVFDAYYLYFALGFGAIVVLVAAIIGVKFVIDGNANDKIQTKKMFLNLFLVLLILAVFLIVGARAPLIMLEVLNL